MNKITIKDIAKIAGVDHSTVSRSLNDSPRVTEATRNRIKELAKELGFEYNYNARALSSKRTYTIGLFFPDTFGHLSKGTFFVSFMMDIHRIFEKEAYNVILEFPKNEHTGESSIKKIMGKNKVDGIMMAAADQMDEEDLKFIKKSKIPCVIIHNKYDGKDDIDEIPSVYTDNFEGGYLATKYLIVNGHKKILTYTHKENGFKNMEFIKRTEGYSKALKEAGLKDYIFAGTIDFNRGETFVDENIDLIKESDAIFAQTDILAISIIQRLREKGINVPEDISVIGYDDIDMCEYLTPHITTIHQPKEEMSKVACEKLIKLLNKEKVENASIYLKPRLVIRDSVKKR